MIDDIRLNKSAIIRRCLARIREEYRDDPARLDDFTIQDSIVLNLLRACEAAIDLAMHLVRERRLGVSQSSRGAFAMLERAGLLKAESAATMMRMCGFRNIAVHNYQEMENRSCWRSSNPVLWILMRSLMNRIIRRKTPVRPARHTPG